jgi:hypothetical protein
MISPLFMDWTGLVGLEEVEWGRIPPPWNPDRRLESSPNGLPLHEDNLNEYGERLDFWAVKREHMVGRLKSKKGEVEWGRIPAPWHPDRRLESSPNGLSLHEDNFNEYEERLDCWAVKMEHMMGRWK